MNSDELTTVVTDLEHYLFDVWKYDELFELGKLFQHLDIDKEPGDLKNREMMRQGQRDLTRSLSYSYELATLQVDEVLPGLPMGPVLDALLERLREHVMRLAQPNAGYFQWLERTWIPTTDEDRTYSDEFGEIIPMGIPVYDDPREHWAYVDHSFQFYVTKVVERIDWYRQRKEVDREQTLAPAKNLNRTKWTCSTAVYVHIVKELLQKGYIAAPDMNGKVGEANITELFKRLSQSFIVTGRDGNELPPDELQRRFDGRKLADAKAARLTFPEAKEVK